jgi:hypothetical protein
MSRPADVPRAGMEACASAFDQADVTGARALRGFLGCEFDALAFSQQLEHRTTDRTAVKEVLDAAFVPDESETFVDQEASNCPGWHTPRPPFRTPRDIPRGTRPGACEGVVTPSTPNTGRASSWLSWKIIGSLGSSEPEVKPGSGFSGNLCGGVHLPGFYVILFVIVIRVFVVVFFVCIEEVIFVIIEIIALIIEREMVRHDVASAGFAAGSAGLGFAGAG